MIKVYQSDTGQFVLVHAPSQSFIIESSLEAGYAKLEAHLKAHHPEMVGKVLEPMDTPATPAQNSRIAHLVLLVALALLPFVWLLVLNHSLASLLTDVQFGGAGPRVEAKDYEYLREDVDLLRLEQNRVLQALHSLSQSVESITEKWEALDTPPADLSAVAGVDETEGAEDAAAPEADAVADAEGAGTETDEAGDAPAE